MAVYCSLEVANRVISIAEIGIGTSFSGPVANVLGDAKVFLVVLSYSLEVADRVISIAEIARGTSFSGPVANVLGDAKVFLVVLYNSLEVAEVFISIAEIAIGRNNLFPYFGNWTETGSCLYPSRFRPAETW